MEKLEFDIGIYDEDAGPTERWRFRGRELVTMPHPEDKEHITLILYECPGGYRVLIHLKLGNNKDYGCVVFVPARDENPQHLLPEKEARERYPSLFAAAGKPLERDLDEECEESSETLGRYAPIGLATTISKRRGA